MYVFVCACGLRRRPLNAGFSPRAYGKSFITRKKVT